MNSTQHTPGPWSIEWDHQSNTPEFIRAFVDGEMEDVAIVTPDTPVANARLIAAAPDLLSALKECITEEGATCFVRSKSNPEYMDRRLNYISEIARSAIAKATA